VTLWLHPKEPVWLWRVEIGNSDSVPVECDAILIQDIGLGERSFILSNETYASQYLDHTIGQHPRFGPIIMSRQNMGQSGHNPWVAHGCCDGAASFATDALQIFGPPHREMPNARCIGAVGLPGERLQHEAACAAIQSRPFTVSPGKMLTRTFFALYDPHHPAATGEADLARLAVMEKAASDFEFADVPLVTPVRSILQDTEPLAGRDLTDEVIAYDFPERRHEERVNGELLSFFVPDDPLNRHIVLATKERQMRRRHGLILRSGVSTLPDEKTLSATCWMHGVFAAQLTIGNTALHKLFSVSRDSYNITRGSGLRILAERNGRWGLLTVPSLFEMGFNDCRWLYQFDDGAIAVHAMVSTEDTAMQWHIAASGPSHRFLIFAHLVLGEHEFRHPGSVEIDHTARRISFRPSPDWLWVDHYPQAIHHLVAGTPQAVEAIGSGALLFDANAPRAADSYAAIRTKPTDRFSFALVGALDDPAHAAALADKYAGGADVAETLPKARAFWGELIGKVPDAEADHTELATILPWFAQNAMVHLTVPRGLEQYSAAAWGTRDVCQGAVEFLLTHGHHQPVRDILRVLFAQQFEASGDWPQWFMLPPYSSMRDRYSHGDIIVWPLKALCDYLEATGDLAFLNEPLPWIGKNFATVHSAPISAHLELLFSCVCGRFIPGTHLIRYGLGDWNDSLQPVDPASRDWMVSAWTVALLYQQISRYARILKDAGIGDAAALLELAARMREDFNAYLMPDGTVAGYGCFRPEGGEPDYLLHPRDSRTGVRYSLMPMVCGIIGGLFTPEQAQDHLALIRTHLLFPDGVRLMDRPIEYRGGPETIFRRAESSSFFGREIGLAYTHAHLRYCEALAALGEIEALRASLRLANPISVTTDVPNASLRQRNTYFSSSDAAFADRYQASDQWERVRNGAVAVEGGWRVYSSGPGIFTRLAAAARGF
jgi:cellobiose phosphorylase